MLPSFGTFSRWSEVLTFLPGRRPVHRPGVGLLSVAQINRSQTTPHLSRDPRELWEMMFSLEPVASQQLDVPNNAQRHLQDTVITFSCGSW